MCDLDASQNEMQVFPWPICTPSRTLSLPEEAVKLANEANFELKGYKFSAAAEDTRAPRIVRIAVVQNAIVKPTTSPVTEQVPKFVSSHARNALVG